MLILSDCQLLARVIEFESLTTSKKIKWRKKDDKLVSIFLHRRELGSISSMYLRTAFMQASPKSKKELLDLTVFFALLGSAGVDLLLVQIMVKLTPDNEFQRKWRSRKRKWWRAKLICFSKEGSCPSFWLEGKQNGEFFQLVVRSHSNNTWHFRGERRGSTKCHLNFFLISNSDFNAFGSKKSS